MKEGDGDEGLGKGSTLERSSRGVDVTEINGTLPPGVDNL